jgi:hypothetical protein
MQGTAERTDLSGKYPVNESSTRIQARISDSIPLPPPPPSFLSSGRNDDTSSPSAAAAAFSPGNDKPTLCSYDHYVTLFCSFGVGSSSKLSRQRKGHKINAWYNSPERRSSADSDLSLSAGSAQHIHGSTGFELFA